MSEHTEIDWKHIQEEVLEMQKILKENGDPDAVSFRSPRYDELRNDILTALYPFKGKEYYYYDPEKKEQDSAVGTSHDDVPFAMMLTKKIYDMNKYTKGMLNDIDDLLYEAYGVILEKIPKYNPDKASFQTYIVTECYFTMLGKFKKEHGQEKSVTNGNKAPDTENTEKKKTNNKLKFNVSFDMDFTGGGTLKDIYSTESEFHDISDEITEENENRIPTPFTDYEFDRVFPKDYFMQEERRLVKVLLSEKNSEFANFTHNLSEWIQKNKQENTTTENDCEYFYDSIIDYICSKGNPVSLARFLGNTGESFSSELKELGLERPSHNAYSADYIYSTCLRIKRRRDRLKKLKN